MSKINHFGILGGDKRQRYLAQSIASDGYPVFAWGLDDIPIKNVTPATIPELVERCDTIILPLPATHDGKYLNAPFGDERILLDDDFANFMVGKNVYAGMINPLISTSDLWSKLSIYDFSTREDFAVRNAVPTAEGAIMIAMEHFDGMINQSKCLVVGYGRIGKVLSDMLHGLGANVTVSARKASDLAWITLKGHKAIRTEELQNQNQFDLVFNTVPALIFTRKLLSKQSSETIFMELASIPGGFDLEAAEQFGLTLIQAPSLPGKVAPKAAGEIIKDTIYNMMEE